MEYWKLSKVVLNTLLHSNKVHHFVLKKLPYKVPNGFSVEASIGTPLGNLLASATAEDMYKAINEVEEKLERQLNKLQHKGESRRADERLKDSFEK